MGNFTTGTLGILASLFLIAMSQTFDVNRGIMGQTNTLTSIITLIFAFVMSVLSIRFKDKSLMLIGMFFFTISAIGCYFALNFITILLFFGINGVGQAMCGPMTNALIGDYVSLAKRESAISWTIAANSLTYLIGAPLMGFLAYFGGWRITLLLFIVPLSIITLIIMRFSLPSSKPSAKTSVHGNSYKTDFKQIESNKSAMGCLVGNVFRFAVLTALLAYGTAFAIQRFDLPISFAAILLLIIAIFLTLGSLFEKRIVNKRGRKPATVLSLVLAGLFTISYGFAPSIWLAVALMSLAGFFDGLVAASAVSLTIEQIPELEGTMMSLYGACSGIGGAIGAGIGGLALIVSGYGLLGIIVGSLGVVGSIIYHFATVDPSTDTQLVQKL